MSWSFQHVRSPTLQQEFERVVDALTDALDFMKTVGADPSANHGGGGPGSNTLQSVDYYTR